MDGDDGERSWARRSLTVGRAGRSHALGPARALVVGLLLASSLPACKSVCQKFADHLEDCRVEYCETHTANPICGDRYEERDNTVAECPDALEPIVESQLEKDCATLAREMGWEALDRMPARQPDSDSP